MIEEHDYKENEPQRDPSLPPNSVVPPADEVRSTQQIPPQSTLRALYTPDLAKPRVPRVKHHSLLGNESVAFYIGDLDEPVVIQVAERITLGRYGPYSSQPSLDLAPYSAFELGVSRLHAAIYRKAGALVFEDMDSNNGSYINAERIAPQVPHRLRSGDVIMLGRLNLEIYFKTVEGSAEPLTPDTVVPDKDLKSDARLNDSPRIIQAFKGTIQFSGADTKAPLQLGAELVMYVKINAGADGRQSLEIAISSDINPTQAQVNELLEKRLKSTEFNLTLK
jgi:pSer/pThr/pTyr-binding forkhead associated (FHA) protein